MERQKVYVKWNKKEKDWYSHFPEWENRNARIVGNCFFLMIQKYEEFMKRDYAGRDTDFISLRDHLESAGFDPDSFTISVKAKIK